MKAKVFKAGVSDEEKFLSDFPVFSLADTVYLTDSKKTVHLFDLKDARYVGAEPFDNVYKRVKGRVKFSKAELVSHKAPLFLEFPNLIDGKDTGRALADQLGMEVVDIYDKEDEQYKRYRVFINSTILADGSLEIEEVKADAELAKEKIVEFFKANKFDRRTIPAIFEKWYLGDNHLYFRKKNDQLARQEKEQELVKERQESERRLTLESIDGIYIPKDLGECFVELDKLLPEVDKREMRALSDREKMIRYHSGLGRSLRNRWGLWGASRLQKYFTDRGVTTLLTKSFRVM